MIPLAIDDGPAADAIGEPSGGVGANQTAEHDGGLNVSRLRRDILQVQVRKQEEQQEGGEGIKPHHREKPGEEEPSKIGMLTRIDPEPDKEFTPLERRSVQQRLLAKPPHSQRRRQNHQDDDGEAGRQWPPTEEDPRGNPAARNSQERHQSHEAGGRRHLSLRHHVGEEPPVSAAADVVRQFDEPKGHRQQDERRGIGQGQEGAHIQDAADDHEGPPPPQARCRAIAEGSGQREHDQRHEGAHGGDDPQHLLSLRGKDLPRDRRRHDNRQQRTPVVVQAEPVQAEEELINQRETPRAHGVAPGVPGRASSRRRIRA